MQEPPQKNTHMRERNISLYWKPQVLVRKPGGESITFDKRVSNCSIIENIPPKGVILSDFICTLAMSDGDLLAFICNTKLGESSDMAKCLAIYYYSVL